MADLIVLAVLAFFIVLAAGSIIRDKRSGKPTCGYVCGDEVCRGRCGHCQNEHMDKETRREVERTIKRLKELQKAQK